MMCGAQLPNKVDDNEVWSRFVWDCVCVFGLCQKKVLQKIMRFFFTIEIGSIFPISIFGFAIETISKNQADKI